MNRARARAARAMVMTMKMVDNREGEGSKAMGEQMVMATKRVVAAMTRLGGTGGGDDSPLRTT